MELPKAGSFQDILLQEVDFRERQLDLARTDLYTTLIERALYMMLNLTQTMAPLPANELTEYRNRLSEQVSELRRSYVAELFQDAYLPEYQQASRLRERLKRKKEMDTAARDAAMAARVEKFSED